MANKTYTPEQIINNLTEIKAKFRGNKCLFCYSLLPQNGSTEKIYIRLPERPRKRRALLT